MSDRTINVQWKGTEACLDFTCDCGTFSHIDGFTFAFIQCWSCGQVWKLSHDVSIAKSNEVTEAIQDMSKGENE